MVSPPPATGKEPADNLEKSCGGRRIRGLSRRLADSRPTTDAAVAELDAAKHTRDVVEQGLRGSGVQASTAVPTRAPEVTVSCYEEEISKIGSDLALMSIGDNERDFQKTVSVTLTDNSHSGSSLTIGQHISENHVVLELEDLINDLVDKAQMHLEEAVLMNKGYIERHECTSSSEDSELDIEGDKDSGNASRPHLPSTSIADKRLRFAALVSNQWQRKPSFMLPDQYSLPTLPEIELLEQSKSIDDSDASSSSSTSNGGDLDAFGSTEWETLAAPLVSLASDEEEVVLMMEAAVRVGDDPIAVEIIGVHDETEARSPHEGYMLNGFPEDFSRTCPTPRDFLLNLLIIYYGKENVNNCMVCQSELKSKARCIRLTCKHIFHMTCIIPWLLKQNKCPGCRSCVTNAAKVQSLPHQRGQGEDIQGTVTTSVEQLEARVRLDKEGQGRPPE